MKKVYALIAAAGLVLGASVASANDTVEGSAAGAGISDSVTVKASVEKYAAIIGLIQTVTTDASGKASSSIGGEAEFSVESNCDVNITITGTDLNNGSDNLDTTWTLDTTTAEGVALPQTYDPSGAVDHTATFGATLGAISAQAAGEYSANLTVTVAAL